MRSFMMMAALSCSPALAAPPLCTLPAPIAISVADSEAEPPTIAAPHPPPDALASRPFVQHVSSAGALMTDLGEAHGIRAVAARGGDQFMLFQVTPDGQAAVSGAIVELTPTQLQTIGATFALGSIFLTAWICEALVSPWTAMRVVLALEFLPFCALFFLLAFYNALLNSQIRVGHSAGWREYLSTDKSFWPR